MPQKAADLKLILDFIQEQAAAAAAEPAAAAAEMGDLPAAEIRSLPALEELRQPLGRYLRKGPQRSDVPFGSSSADYEAGELEAPGPGTYERLERVGWFV